MLNRQPMGQFSRPEAARTQGEQDGDGGRKRAGARNSISPSRDMQGRDDGRQEKRGRDSRSPLRDSTWGSGQVSRAATFVGANARQIPQQGGRQSNFMQVCYSFSSAEIHLHCYMLVCVANNCDQGRDRTPPTQRAAEGSMNLRAEYERGRGEQVMHSLTQSNDGICCECNYRDMRIRRSYQWVFRVLAS